MHGERMENMIIAEMSRDELIRLIAEKSGTLDLDVLKQALDRIDMLDGKENAAAESAIADINDEAFEDLPLDEQLKKLMKANQAYCTCIKKFKTHPTSKLFLMLDVFL